jgi:hypothetical protein
MATRPTPPSLTGYSEADKQRIMRDFELKMSDYNRQQGIEDEQTMYARSRADKERLDAENRVESERLYQRSKADEYQKWLREKNLVKTSTTETSMPSWDAPTSYDIPTYQPYIPGAAPTYAAPKWDDNAIESLTQKKAAPGLRNLRQQVQRVTGRRYDNPQVGRMTLREALQGYGSGIGSVMGSAGEVATGEYAKKYATQADEAKTNYGGAMAQWQGETSARSEGARSNYQADLDRRKTMFNAAWDKWKASTGTRTTSTTR